ncbi:putative WD repeat-containing protein [Wickerhamomyces ciferrii]|uniref:WD repeat-containing protein n=1 Tax=Wickerhamomyces ciferrii (strain ATCC 14091 / BCRC 22168 / CBS 111 / JCM 3599 / NBRC 0793 / NRRL Y-1031 F-60-10) TaxID=1206466 RepID=K0KJ13_WICCF|nr:putative WD repeat-containing protein [Wickerhamomyces ciferrii]CCH41449.1 putative WD repeat-containing protein [Wickerhamomyces ciferrii]
MTKRSPKKRDRILDRFIPSKASRATYRIYRHREAHSPRSPQDATEYRLPGVIGSPLPRMNDRSTVGGIQDHSLLNLASTSILDGITALGSRSSGYLYKTMETDIDGHKGAIADALNLNYNNKVLKFAANDSRGSNGIINDGSFRGTSSGTGTGDSSYIDVSIPSIHQSLYRDEFSLNVDDTSLSSTHYDSSPKSKQRTIKTKIPCDLLSAAHLTKDFYTNLISWSRLSNSIAVGLAHQVCLWGGTDSDLIDATDPHDAVTSVGFSNDEYLAIGTKLGRLVLYSQMIGGILDAIVLPAASLSTIEWFPNSSRYFVTGDQFGQVFIFCVERGDSPGLKLLKQFKSQQQQVCGISINDDLKQMAVGGNDNCCHLWNIEDLENPRLEFSLPHQAAVKAIAYCPWSKSLLATGGGTKDRTIRFWHTKTGTLLQSYKTEGQITSLVWSRNKKQICATFGFCEGHLNDTLVGVYTYPKMEKLIQVGDQPGIRILSCALSPDSTSICVTLTDETVRFYEVWDANGNIIRDSTENGVLYSDLIELTEGITKPAGFIR